MHAVREKRSWRPLLMMSPMAILALTGPLPLRAEKVVAPVIGTGKESTAPHTRTVVAQLVEAQAKTAGLPSDSDTPLLHGPDASGQIAALPAPDTSPDTKMQGSTGNNPRLLARSLQTELKRVGCDPGRIDGTWGPKARDALGEFARLAKLSLSTHEPTTAALDAVSAQHQRVCPLTCDPGETIVGERCVARSADRPHKQTQRARAKDDAPRIRARVVDAPSRRARVEGPAKTNRLCWAQDGRAFSVTSCN